MTENVENLILEHLRRLREGQGEILAEIRELKARQTLMEENFALLRTDIAQLHTMYAGLSRRMDRMDERLTRIERRLDLVEVPQT